MAKAAQKIAKSNGPTDEQLQELLGLEEKLMSVALEECDPDGWMTEEKAEAEAKEADELAAKVLEAAEQAAQDGDQKKAKKLQAEAFFLTKQAIQIRKGWKGERYWEKKNATATVSLLTKLEMYRQRIAEGRQPGKAGAPDEDEKIAAEIKAAEGKVKGRLSLVKKRAVV